MKLLFIFVAVCYGQSAFACPQINDKFMCTNIEGGEGDSLKTNMTTTITNGVYSYYYIYEEVGSLTFIADGLKRVLEDTPYSTVSFIVTCSDNKIFIKNREDTKSDKYSGKTSNMTLTYDNDKIIVKDITIWDDGIVDKTTDVCTALK